MKNVLLPLLIILSGCRQPVQNDPTNDLPKNDPYIDVSEFLWQIRASAEYRMGECSGPIYVTSDQVAPYDIDLYLKPQQTPVRTLFYSDSNCSSLISKSIIQNGHRESNAIFIKNFSQSSTDSVSIYLGLTPEEIDTPLTSVRVRFVSDFILNF